MSEQLEQGICKRLNDASQNDQDLFLTPHTVQVLSVKTVGQGTSPNERYRIILSDGVHFIQAMLATQLNDMVASNQLTKNCIATVEKLSCNYVQERRLFIVLALRVIGSAPDRLGNPIGIGEAKAKESPAPDASTSAAAPQQQAPQQPQRQQQQQQQSSTKQQQASRNGGRPNMHPIEALSPYQNNWSIKARCTQKSEIKTWANARGEGKLFNVTLMDETGEIKGTAFNTVVDDLYPKFEEGKVYYISKARVNLAKKKFSNLTCDYELSFERNTEVEECLEITNLPTVKYTFVPLENLEKVEKDQICDVIAIVKEVGPVSEIITKATNKPLSKRELVLVDKTAYSVRLTLWGKQAENFKTDEETPVIAFKAVRVGDFGGRSLSMIGSSSMAINPDLEETYTLRGWYDAAGSSETFLAHSRSGAASTGGGGFNRNEQCSLGEVRERGLGQSDQKADYFSTRATIMHIKPENIAYPACSSVGCQKKVLQEGDGWRCEKCSITHPNPKWRYIISMAVADWSMQAWFQGFNDVGEEIFGQTADQLMEAKERSDSEYNIAMHKANCQTYNFACRAKQDTYNDTARTRYGIMKITKLDYKEEANVLLDLLNSPWAQ